MSRVFADRGPGEPRFRKTRQRATLATSKFRFGHQVDRKRAARQTLIRTPEGGWIHLPGSSRCRCEIGVSVHQFRTAASNYQLYPSFP